MTIAHDSSGIIRRPFVDVEFAGERAAQRQRHAERLAELERLDVELDRIDLEIYLEQRSLYRGAVREGRHAGMRPPENPKYRTDSRKRQASAPATEARSRPSSPDLPDVYRDPRLCSWEERAAAKQGPRVVVRPACGAILDVR